MKNIQDFKKQPGEASINNIKEKIDYVDPIMRKANQTFGVDIISYEDRLASNISALVTEVSKDSIAKFGKRKEQQTDAALQQFKETQDQCIIVWDYLKALFVILAILGLITLMMSVGIGDLGLTLVVILNSFRIARVKDPLF